MIKITAGLKNISTFTTFEGVEGPLTGLDPEESPLSIVQGDQKWSQEWLAIY